MSEFDNMVEFLDSTWILKDQLVPCLVGPVGIGKTAAVHQHAKNVGANKVVEIIASQILPNEVSGITMPDSDTKAMEIYDHFRLSSLENGDILFFDELLEADQMVLSACLTLIESRNMMSGKPLPDIQIIAATNPTIQPNMLKENIRQRFLFRKFSIDITGIRNYIKEDCGFNVPNSVLSCLAETGSEYNILSPRSLTKMCRWIAATPMDKLEDVAKQINLIWGTSMGNILAEAWSKNPENNIEESKKVLKETVSAINPELAGSLDFKESSLEELMDILTSSDEWESIEKILSSMPPENTENFNSEVMEF